MNEKIPNFIEAKNEYLGLPFDPLREFEKLKQTPKKERRHAVGAFKERLMAQREESAMAEDELLAVFRKNPDDSNANILSSVNKRIAGHGLSEAEQKFYRDTAEEMIARRILLKKIRKENPENRQLFKKLFGFSPAGAIRIEVGPLNLRVIIETLNDFARIRGGGYLKNRPSTKREREDAVFIGGHTLNSTHVPGLDHAVILINRSEQTKEIMEEADVNMSYRGILAHEEQHVVNEFITEKKIAAYLGGIAHLEAGGTDGELIKAALLLTRKYEIEWKFKNEVLAFVRGGTRFDDIKEQLLDDRGAYSTDYCFAVVRRGLKRALGDSFAGQKDLIELLIKKILGSELRRIKKRALDAVEALWKQGLSREHIVSLLQSEPLFRWPNFARRYSNYINKTTN